jgi:hypothetical protein
MQIREATIQHLAAQRASEDTSQLMRDITDISAKKREVEKVLKTTPDDTSIAHKAPETKDVVFAVEKRMEICGCQWSPCLFDGTFLCQLLCIYL